MNKDREKSFLLLKYSQPIDLFSDILLDKYILQEEYQTQAAEEILSNCPASSYRYAVEILGNDRFRVGEKAILSDVHYADYISNILIPNCDENDMELIASNAFMSYEYVGQIVKGRWEPGEEAIATSSVYSYLYALHFIKGRFKPGERVISEHPNLACRYAVDVIRGRWEPGESAINKWPSSRREYHKFLESIKA